MHFQTVSAADKDRDNEDTDIKHNEAISTIKWIENGRKNN